MISGKPRILCVDDEPEILKFLEAVLVRSGYEVLKAHDGEEALKTVEQERVDLVLSDVKMPKLDGPEVCRRIKGSDRLRDIPVILITGVTAKEDRIKGIEAGAEDFLAKPIDQAEVLARIKVLLKVKSTNERRIGELLVEMKFITEDHLQEALKVSRTENIRLADALYSMGALDKDHIYWVLSNQLNMNYVELSPEMLDEKLIQQFPLSLLEDLECLPLYEADGEIHFAIADPTNRVNLDGVRGLKPERLARLHLALPEKIREMLERIKRNVGSSCLPNNVIPFGGINTVPSRNESLSQQAKDESTWSDFKSLLFAMPQGGAYWLHRSGKECRLASQAGNDFHPLRDLSGEMFRSLKEHLSQQDSPQESGRKSFLVLDENSGERQGLFQWRHLHGLNREIIKIERMPAISMEKVMMAWPQIPVRVADLQRLVKASPLLLIGSSDRYFLKQCVYLAFTRTPGRGDFLPPFFIECDLEVYLPKVIQCRRDRLDLEDFLQNVWMECPAPLFVESEIDGEASNKAFFSSFFSGAQTPVVLGVSFPSPETMQRALSKTDRWDQAGFKAIFLSPSQMKPISEEFVYAKT